MTMTMKVKLMGRIMDVAHFCKGQGMSKHEAIEAIRGAVHRNYIPVTNREIRLAVANTYAAK